MEFNLIQEINNMKYISCLKIEEKSGTLIILSMLPI